MKKLVVAMLILGAVKTFSCGAGAAAGYNNYMKTKIEAERLKNK